jgi:hypothetical protein
MGMMSRIRGRWASTRTPRSDTQSAQPRVRKARKRENVYILFKLSIDLI